MKRLFFVLLFSLMTVALTYAQDTKPRTSKGDVSFNFTIYGFGSFGLNGPLVGTTPQGNTLGDTLIGSLYELFGMSYVHPVWGVGATYFVADNMAIRLSLGFNTVSNTTPINDSVDTKDSKFTFGIAPALQVHLVNAGPVTAFTGVALSFATSSISKGEDSLEQSSTQTGFGGGAILGAEFFPWDNISLGVESQFGVTLNSTSTKNGNKSAVDGKSSVEIGFILPFAVNLGIHF
jgi:hypothetical protein